MKSSQGIQRASALNIALPRCGFGAIALAQQRLDAGPNLAVGARPIKLGLPVFDVQALQRLSKLLATTATWAVVASDERPLHFAKGLLQRRDDAEPIGIEDVHAIQPDAFQALVKLAGTNLRNPPPCPQGAGNMP